MWKSMLLYLCSCYTFSRQCLLQETWGSVPWQQAKRIWHHSTNTIICFDSGIWNFFCSFPLNRLSLILSSNDAKGEVKQISSESGGNFASDRCHWNMCPCWNSSTRCLTSWSGMRSGKFGQVWTYLSCPTGKLSKEMTNRWQQQRLSPPYKRTYTVHAS